MNCFDGPNSVVADAMGHIKIRTIVNGRVEWIETTIDELEALIEKALEQVEP
jgi:hypothetical protein